MWLRSETKTASLDRLAARVVRTASQRLERVPALVLAQDPVGRHAVVDRVRAGHGGLGRPVTGLLAAGHHQEAVVAGLEQVDGMLQPRLEDRRRPAVVLGRAEDHDRAGRPGLVLEALLPDPERAVDGHAQQRRRPSRREPDQRPAHAGRGHRPWHFLYFRPEPQKQTSLRPIRRPSGA